MATVQGAIVTPALQDLGVISSGETPDSEDSALGLARLNRMIDTWAAERLTIYHTTRTTWTITASDGSYTLGATGDIAIVRPVFIDSVGYIDTSADPDIELPLHPLTVEDYARISQKAQTGTYPTSWYYNPTFANGAIELWPVPTSTTLSGVIYAPTALTSYAALTTTFTLPPGYEEALSTNLAVRLAPAFGRSVPKELHDQAARGVELIKRGNSRMRDLLVDAAMIFHGSGAYSIDTGP